MCCGLKVFVPHAFQIVNPLHTAHEQIRYKASVLFYKVTKIRNFKQMRTPSVTSSGLTSKCVWKCIINAQTCHSVNTTTLQLSVLIFYSTSPTTMWLLMCLNETWHVHWQFVVVAWRTACILGEVLFFNFDLSGLQESRMWWSWAETRGFPSQRRIDLLITGSTLSSAGSASMCPCKL